MSRYLLTCVLFLLYMNAKAQSMISGKITDEFNNPISNVSISYKKIDAVAISGFSRSGNDGSFSLTVKLIDADSVQLDFSHLSYQKKTAVVPLKTGTYNFVLTQAANMLQEVMVSDPPIFKRNDTLNYNVEVFTSQHDRFISDIIRKLPGIEMRGDAIYYQGKPIQKYKVNNLDLMEGRYSIINKNLPADAVKNIQIIENDQPIKILDSLVFSDRATINLDLKKFTTTGSGKVGLGSDPFLWDVNVTPMILGKTFQMLASFQSNNVGYDAASELRMFYPGGAFINTRERINDGPSYISLRDVNTPNFEQSKWLDNKIFLFSGNVLQKLKNNLEIKGNASYIEDTQSQAGFTATRSFTSDEILLTTEGIDNHDRIRMLDIGASIEKNEKEIYLRNKFQYHKRWNRDVGELLLNQQSQIHQQRNYTDEAFMNSLSMARFLGKQLINITSNFEWHRTPQRLHVSPGQFEDILNDGRAYQELGQQVFFNSLDWHNQLRFTRKLGRLRLAPAVSVNYESRDLDTKIERTVDGVTDTLGTPFINEMKNQQMELGLNLGIFWETPRWKLAIATPYSAFYFDVTQQGQKTMDKEIRHTFYPSASLKYLRSSRSEWGLRFSGGKQYGGLNNFYNAFIIKQYRNMQRYDARLLATDEMNAMFSYQYKNTMKANFANASYSYSSRDRDYIFTTQLDSLGRRTTSIANRSSRSNTHSIHGGVGSFFKTIKTIVKINGGVDWTQADYLLNNVMADQQSYGYAANLELINNLSPTISGEYKIEIGGNINKFSAGQSNKIFYTNHFLDLIFSPFEKHHLIVNNSYYRNNITGQSNQFFLDATYRYHLKKWRTDIELTASNLLDNDQYVMQMSSTFDLVQSYFNLRPRQFMLSTKFRF